MTSHIKPHPSPRVLIYAMKQAGITIDDIALLESTSRTRIKQWVDGEDQIPFRFFWTMPLLLDQGNLSMARIMAQRAKEEGPEFFPWNPLRSSA